MKGGGNKGMMKGRMGGGGVDRSEETEEGRWLKGRKEQG